MGLPWWLRVKNLPANAGDCGFDAWCGKIPHAAKQLRTCAMAPEPVLQSPGATAPEAICRSY